MLGRCMGGIVAYEMAVQLQAQGEEVSFLGILDTQSPPRLTPRDWKYYAAELVKRVVHYAREGKLIKGFVGLYMKKARRRQSEDPGERLLQHVMDTHARARRHYIPAPLFEGEVTIIKNTEASLEAQEGWTALAPGGLQTIEAPGDHQTMLEGEHVGAFVEVLTSALHAERDDSAAENIDYSESEQSAA